MCQGDVSTAHFVLVQHDGTIFLLNETKTEYVILTEA